MKVALINDQHFGARNDSAIFDRFFERFYTEIFFPTLEDRGIKQILDGGDLFERRKYTNHEILANCRRYYLDRIQNEGYRVEALMGNHNIYHKDDSHLNNLNLLLHGYPAFTIHKDPYEWQDLILFVPWITKENYDRTIKAIEASTCPLVYGHLEISGFQMDKGQICSHGIDKKLFSKFQKVFSGHFHHKNTDANIMYLGSPYEMTWADWDDPKGFHILDTDTLELEFIKNPFTIYRKIHYDDVSNKDFIVSILEDGVKMFSETYTKIIVTKREDQTIFNTLFDTLSAICHNLEVVDNHQGLVLNTELTGEVQKSIDESVLNEDTQSFLQTSVDSLVMPSGIDQNKVKNELSVLYHDALSITSAI